MSTKIYTAYKIKKSSDLWSVVRAIKKKGQANVSKVLSEQYTSARSEVSTEDPKYRTWIVEANEDDWTARHRAVRRSLSDQYFAQSTKSVRNDYDFDVCVTVRELRGSLYLIPYADMPMRGVLDFMKRDKRLQDFAYWNSSDKPKHLSSREWSRRKGVWDELYDRDWHEYLLIDICSVIKWQDVDPWHKDLLTYLAQKKGK